VILREEIDAVSVALGIDASNVQRDYVFGWILAGLYGDSDLGGQLVLKGGNALRKGYFPATRFSDDLDFAAPGRVDPGLLLEALNNACRLTQARTGVVFDLDRIRQIGGHAIDHVKSVFKYKLYFVDFYGAQRNVTISLRVDVTEFGRFYLPTQSRQLIHPYSDNDGCAVDIQVVSLEEALADKMKCLLQRRSSFDLFDLVYSIFVNTEVEVDKTAVVSAFLKKTIFGASPPAAHGLLSAVPFEAMRHFWDSKIVCVRESLLDFTSAVSRFKSELASMFSPFDYGERNRVAFYPAELRTPIMEAGATKTLLRVVYDGVERLVEPYALTFKRRKDGIGQEYLYVWDQTGGRSSGPGIKMLQNWKVQQLSNTDTKFEPRFEVELAKAGEFSDRTGFSSGAREHRASMSRRSVSASYRIKCLACGRTFTHAKPSLILNKHKDSHGYPCRSRRGYRV
jgi:predicted nucleotidyltransferase component of viral defense system